MRLKSGNITKKEVRNPTRRYVRKMVTPRNNNGEQPSNSVGVGTITASSTGPISSIARTTTIPSTTIMLSTMIVPSKAQEGILFSPSITQSHLVTPTPTMTDFRPFSTSFIMLMLGREQPYGMPTSMMLTCILTLRHSLTMLRIHIHQYWHWDQT